MPDRSPFLGAAIALTVGLAGCGDDGAGDQDAFCEGLRTNLSAIVQPSIATAEDADAYVAMLQGLADDAPLAIEEDWEALVLAYETANAVEPDDAESEQLAAAAAYAMERSAINVKDWAQRNCGVDMGPVATVPNAPPPTATPGSGDPTGSAPSTTAAT